MANEALGCYVSLVKGGRIKGNKYSYTIFFSVTGQENRAAATVGDAAKVLREIVEELIDRAENPPPVNATPAVAEKPTAVPVETAAE